MQTCFENNGFVQNTYHALRPFYGQHDRPSKLLIRLIIVRFHTTFTLNDNTHPQGSRIVRAEDGIAAVERSVEEDLNQSIYHRAHKLDMCPSPLWTILRKADVKELSTRRRKMSHSLCHN